MTLRTCRECGAKVSAHDDVCTNCGVHFPTASNPIIALGKSDRMVGDFMRLSAVAVIVLVLFGMMLIG